MVRWAALGGVVSPVVLVAATLVVAAGRPDYAHTAQTLSELGAVGRAGADTMNWMGIIPAGILIALSSISVTAWFGRGGLSTVGGLLLGVGGLLLGASALAPWRAGLPSGERESANALHLALALGGFAMIGLAPLVFGIRRRSWPSIVAGALVLGLASGQLQNGYAGAFQKTALLVFYVWLSVTCVVILTRKDSGLRA